MHHLQYLRMQHGMYGQLTIWLSVPIFCGEIPSDRMQMVHSKNSA